MQVIIDEKAKQYIKSKNHNIITVDLHMSCS